MGCTTNLHFCCRKLSSYKSVLPKDISRSFLGSQKSAFLQLGPILDCNIGHQGTKWSCKTGDWKSIPNRPQLPYLNLISRQDTKHHLIKLRKPILPSYRSSLKTHEDKHPHAPNPPTKPFQRHLISCFEDWYPDARARTAESQIRGAGIW